MRNQVEIDDDEATPRRTETTKIMVGVCEIEIENIKEMRCRRGIEDIALQQEIRGLEIGDLVKLTRVTGTEPFGGETLLVRVTAIRGHRFQGQLAKRPSSKALSKIPRGAPVAFTTAHIHSLVKSQPTPGQ